MNTHDIEYLTTKLKRNGLTVHQTPTIGEPTGLLVKTKGGFLHFKDDLTMWGYNHLPIVNIYIRSFSGVTQLGRYLDNMCNDKELKL